MAMTEETGKGAWRWQLTLHGDGSTECEQYWDPEATPLSEAEAARRYREILEILFGPIADGQP
jgi:hypothetical protein